MSNQIFKWTSIFLLTTLFANADTAFETTLNLGLTLTEGNSETLLGNAALVSTGKRSCGTSIRLGAEGNYGESKLQDTKQTTVENIRGFITAQQNISKRWYAALNTAALYDNIAEIDYRFILGPAFGGYLLRGEKVELTAELGPSYIWERVARDRDNYLALRVAERFTYQLSDTAQIWQSAEFIPKTEEFDDFLVKTEVGVSAAMNSKMQLRVVLQWNHDSTPGPELEKDDFTLISGLGIKL